jgi:hypothetical protein
LARKRRTGGRSFGWSDGRAGREAAADEERFSKWVLECKWNNDKLKRQAEVLAGRNGRRRRWQRAAGSVLC